MVSRGLLALLFASTSFAAGAAAEPETRPASPSPEALEAACSRNEPAACTALGYLVASTRAFPPDVPRAFDLWRKGCAAGHLPACIPYGEVLLTGYEAGDVRRYVGSVRSAEKISRDRSEGRRVLARACDGGQARACDILGISWLGEKPKLDQACPLFGRACTAGDSGGCWDQVRHCERQVPVTVAATSAGTKAGARVNLRVAAFDVDRNGPIVVASSVARSAGGPSAETTGVARIDRVGRLTWLTSLPAGPWRLAGCPDGRTTWLADGRRLFRVDGPGRAVPVALPPAPPTPQTTQTTNDSPPEIVACLPDGSAVIAHAVAGTVTDDDYRRHLDSHPGLLDQPEVAVLQRIRLWVHPHNRPREVDRGRALIQRLAAELRRGKPWMDAAKEAKDGWYSSEAVEERHSPPETPTPGAPPAELFRLSEGQIFGPVEELQPVQRGRFDRWKGQLEIWRVVSRAPARAPAPEEAVARARSVHRARIVNVVIAAPGKPVEHHHLPVISVSRIGADGKLGPLVPLEGGGFALLGDNRQVWKGGRWSAATPLLTAIGSGPVLDAVRDGKRIAVLSHVHLRVFDHDGRLLAEAPPSRIADGAFYPRRLGVAGPSGSGFLLVSPNLSHLGVLALDDRLAIRWVDQLHADGNQTPDQSIAFAESGLWHLIGNGAAVASYQKRQVTEYQLFVPSRR